MDRPAQAAREAEEAIRVWLRTRRGSLHLSYRDMERETGIRHSWLSDFDRAQYAKVLASATLEARKHALAVAYPDLLPLLVELSLAWLPDAARARLALAWAPAPSGDGE